MIHEKWTSIISSAHKIKQLAILLQLIQFGELKDSTKNVASDLALLTSKFSCLPDQRGMKLLRFWRFCARRKTSKIRGSAYYTQKLQNRRFCAHRKNSKIGGFA